jgi:L-2-hydroxyglutarate oxidase LhgO
MSEIRDSMSIRRYMEAASRYVPEIGPDDVERGRVGVRAQAVDRDGSLVDDFRIYESDGVVSVRNAPSPGATSSLAIAEYIVDRMSDLP